MPGPKTAASRRRGVWALATLLALPGGARAQSMNDGNLNLNPARDAFVLTGGLADLVADTQAEHDQLVIGQGFSGIVHLKRGLEAPNLHIYVVSINSGTIYRIRGSVPVSLQGFTVE
jgi:hypothetical protein